MRQKEKLFSSTICFPIFVAMDFEIKKQKQNNIKLLDFETNPNGRKARQNERTKLN